MLAYSTSVAMSDSNPVRMARFRLFRSSNDRIARKEMDARHRLAPEHLNWCLNYGPTSDSNAPDAGTLEERVKWIGHNDSRRR